MTKLRKFEEQFERVKRWYNLFKEINDGKAHTRDTDYYQDIIYAFFQNCYHLKDWIKNDNTITPKENVEHFINKNECMRLCADICNATKHLELLPSHKRSGEDPKVGSRKFSLDISTQTIDVKYCIITNSGKKINAFDLATDCIHKWEEFINKEIK